MSHLTLDYRHCAQLRPLFLKHTEVEALAARIRQQLVDATTDAIPLEVLSGVAGLSINGVSFELYVGTEEVIHDEHGKPVLGICEYDPGVPDTAMVSVAPVGENADEALVRSTLGHELGHAIFDAPGWILAASQGPGLFDDLVEAGQKAYRTITPDAKHLARAPTPTSPPGKAFSEPSNPMAQAIHFAELRANAFMGSLLVPRQSLLRAAEDLAPEYGVTIERSPSLGPGWPAPVQCLTVFGTLVDYRPLLFSTALGKRFGVHPRFIEVRLQHYGLFPR